MHSMHTPGTVEKPVRMHKLHVLHMCTCMYEYFAICTKMSTEMYIFTYIHEFTYDTNMYDVWPHTCTPGTVARICIRYVATLSS